MSAIPQDSVRITASRIPGAVALEVQDAVVVPREHLAQQPLLSDALQGVAQLHADQAGGRGGFSSVYIRGADPNHAVVLIDGVKVNDPTNSRGGGFDLSSIDPRTLERVEILPGASSAVYGADAMGGVVSLLSAQPSGSGLRAMASYGGLGNASAFAEWDGDRLRLVASSLEEGNEALGMNKLRTVAARSGAVSVRAVSRESRGYPEDSGGPAYAVRRVQERRDGEALVASTQFSSAYEAAMVRLRIGGVFQQQRIESPGVSPGLRDPAGLPPTVSDSDFHRVVSAISAETAHFRLALGYEHEKGALRSTLFFGPVARAADFSLTRETGSLAGEFRHQIDDLFLNFGARLEATSGFKPQPSFTAAARQLFAWGAAAGSIGTGFKPPSFFSLGHPLIGNPALRPERSTSLELSLSSTSDAPIVQRGAMFATRYRDLIDFDAGPPPTLVNRDQARIYGIEYSVSGDLARGLKAGGSVSSLSFQLPENTPPLRNRPRSKATGMLTFRVADAGSLIASATRVGRVADSSVPTGNVTLPSYAMVNLAFTYKKSGVDLVFAVDNAFDKDYEQFVGFPAPGRRLRVQASIGF